VPLELVVVAVVELVISAVVVPLTDAPEVVGAVALEVVELEPAEDVDPEVIGLVASVAARGVASSPNSAALVFGLVFGLLAGRAPAAETEVSITSSG
jgi:hypothetical protein